MRAFERRLEIAEQLKTGNVVNVEELARRYFVCESTIRRDLDRLVREGMAKRTYGGAILLDNSTSDLPMLIRERENIEAKTAIARQHSNEDEIALGYKKIQQLFGTDCYNVFLRLEAFNKFLKNITVALR